MFYFLGINTKFLGERSINNLEFHREVNEVINFFY